MLAIVRALVLGRWALVAENALLRHQIAVLRRSVKQPHFRRRDRLLWVIISRMWQGWRECIVLVQPGTVVKWHREGFRLYWRWKSRGGRPGVRHDVRALVRRIAAENPLWGVPRIQAELALLGHRLARATVAKYIGRSSPTSPTWRTFIQNHLNCTAAIDFFTVPTLTGRVLYGFIVLAHDRRRVLHFNVTSHPTATWVARQLREAFPFNSALRFLIRDNDAIFGEEVSRCLRSLGIEEVLTSLGSPWQNAYAERFIGTLRRECLDHVIILNEKHLLRVVHDYLAYYHRDRPHQGLGRDSPDGRAVEAEDRGAVVSEVMSGGLHHRYRRAA